MRSHTKESVTAGLKRVGYTDWKLSKFRNHKEVQFQHSCGHKMWSAANSFINRPHKTKACPKCGGQNGTKLSETVLKERCSDRGFTLVARMRRKAGGRTALKIKCKKCSTIRDITPDYLIKAKNPCLVCAPKADIRTVTSPLMEVRTVVVDGIEFHVQGVEDLAIQYLVQVKGIAAKDILTVHDHSNVPVVHYKFKGRNRRYYPDLFVPSQNLIVEAKGPVTMGLTGNSMGKSKSGLTFKKNAAKIKAVRRDGYLCLFLVFYRCFWKGTHVRHRLPSGWENMPRRVVKSKVRQAPFTPCLS